jgi:DNA-binding GntR family transcriptional regulator
VLASDIGAGRVSAEERLLEPVFQPAPLRDSVYRSLEELIIFGALKPGQHLVETSLAKQLHVSRAPVREALQLLHRDGWIDLRPRQGAFVHQPTLQEVDETFHVRTLLEVESARLAASHRSEEALQSLKETLEAGDEAFERGDGKALVIENSTFHEKVAQSSGNEVLSRMISGLDKRIRWYFAPVVKQRALKSWREHAEIVKAIRAGAPDLAAELMRRHAEHTRAAYHNERERAEAGP